MESGRDLQNRRPFQSSVFVRTFFVHWRWLRRQKKYSQTWKNFEKLAFQEGSFVFANLPDGGVGTNFDADTWAVIIFWFLLGNQNDGWLKKFYALQSLCYRFSVALAHASNELLFLRGREIRKSTSSSPRTDRTAGNDKHELFHGKIFVPEPVLGMPPRVGLEKKEKERSLMICKWRLGMSIISWTLNRLFHFWGSAPKKSLLSGKWKIFENLPEPPTYLCLQTQIIYVYSLSKMQLLSHSRGSFQKGGPWEAVVGKAAELHAQREIYLWRGDQGTHHFSVALFGWHYDGRVIISHPFRYSERITTNVLHAHRIDQSRKIISTKASTKAPKEVAAAAIE